MANRFTVEAIFKAVDRVTAPVRKMQKRLNKFTSSATIGLRKLNRVIGRTVKGLGRVAKAVGKFGGVALAGLATGAALVVKQFSRIEDAQASFTPILGGADKARQAVEALNKTAATTPFQFLELADAAQQLFPIMGADIDNVIATIRQMGDVAGGNTQKLQSITRGFTKALLKGKTDLESLNIIAEAGVPIFSQLTDQMGLKTPRALFKLISAGKVSTKELKKAFRIMTSEGGLFFKAMEIRSKTLSGRFSTLQDNVSLMAAELGEILAPTLKDIIDSLTDAAKAAKAWIKENKTDLVKRFTEFVTGFKESVLSTVEALKKWNAENDVLERLGVIIRGISDAFGFLRENGAIVLKVVGALAAMVIGVQVLTAALIIFKAGLAVFAFLGGPVTVAILAFAALAALIITNWEPIKEFFINLWGDITQIFDDAMANVLATIKVITDGISFAVDKVRSLGSAAASGISAAVDKASSIGGAALSLVGLGGGDDDGSSSGETPARPDAVQRAQVAGPSERTSRSIQETINTSRSSAEVTIRAGQGVQADVTGGSLGNGIDLISSGDF